MIADPRRRIGFVLPQSGAPATVMTLAPLVPKGEALRRAVMWLAEHREWSPARVNEASLQFDLSPLDEEFLLREARRVRESPARPGTPRAADR
jgi:hypothetical protein